MDRIRWRKTAAGLLCLLVMVSALSTGVIAAGETEAGEGTVQPGAVPPEGEMPGFIHVAQPATHVAGDLSVVQAVSSAAEMRELTRGALCPSTAWMELDAELRVSPEGHGSREAGIPLMDFLEATAFSVIPALYVRDDAAAEALAAFVRDSGFSDLIVVSDRPELIQFVREAAPAVSAALDLRGAYTGVLTDEMCLDIRRQVHTCGAMMAVLPSAVLTRQNVNELFHSQIPVWAWAGGGDGEAELLSTILMGVTGIIGTRAQSETAWTAASRLPENTLTRLPLIVGHRGLPSKAPENTLEGARLAYEAGANAVELDIYLTQDGQLAVMHDAATGRTCDRNLAVEGSTMAELKELYVNKGFEQHPTLSRCRIPTLAEFFEAFWGLDFRIFIEIKSTRPEIVTVLKELIDRYEIEDQCYVITFHEGILRRMKEAYPAMPVGALCGQFMGGENPDEDLRKAMDYIGRYNATLNPAFAGYDAEDCRRCLMRGISVYPWTFSGGAEAYGPALVWGYAGLTGNNSEVFAQFTNELRFGEDRTAFEVGDTVELAMRGLNAQPGDRRRSRFLRTPADCLILEGADVVETGRNQMEFVEAGTVTFRLFAALSFGGQSYALCTDPITLTASGPVTETSAPETTVPPVSEPVGTESTAPETGTTAVVPADPSAPVDPSAPAGASEDGGGCRSQAAGIGSMIVIVIGAAYGLRRRRSDSENAMTPSK